jgi:hypothetical protein
MQSRLALLVGAVTLSLTALSMRGTVSAAAATENNNGGASQYVALQVPGFEMTTPFAVNNRGEVAGIAYKCIPDQQSGSPTYEQRGFRYWNGRYSLMDVPGASGISPMGINSKGEVVGYLYTARQTLEPFIWYQGQVSFIETGVTDFVVSGINSRGDIVAWTPEGQAFLLRGNQLVSLTPPGSVSTQAWGINSSGVIVGNTYSPQSGATAFIYDDGRYKGSSAPGFLYGINDRGDLLSEQPGLSPRMNIYRDGLRLNLNVPEPDYTILGLSNTRVVGVLPATLNANGCYEARGFIVGLPE